MSYYPPRRKYSEADPFASSDSDVDQLFGSLGASDRRLYDHLHRESVLLNHGHHQKKRHSKTRQSTESDSDTEEKEPSTDEHEKEKKNDTDSDDETNDNKPKRKPKRKLGWLKRHKKPKRADTDSNTGTDDDDTPKTKRSKNPDSSGSGEAKRDLMWTRLNTLSNQLGMAIWPLGLTFPAINLGSAVYVYFTSASTATTGTAATAATTAISSSIAYVLIGLLALEGLATASVWVYALLHAREKMRKKIKTASSKLTAWIWGWFGMVAIWATLLGLMIPLFPLPILLMILLILSRLSTPMLFIIWWGIIQKEIPGLESVGKGLEKVKRWRRNKKNKRQKKRGRRRGKRDRDTDDEENGE